MVAALDRREGFLRGMRAMGIEIPAGYMQTGDWSEWSGTQAMERLLRLSPWPDAVFVASDNMAAGRAEGGALGWAAGARGCCRGRLR